MTVVLFCFLGGVIVAAALLLWRWFDRRQTKQMHSFMDRAGGELEQIAQETEDQAKGK